MRRDPIVEEVRRIRDKNAKKFGNDLHAICEDLRRKQTASNHPVVSRPPRKPTKRRAA